MNCLVKPIFLDNLSQPIRPKCSSRRMITAIKSFPLIKSAIIITLPNHGTLWLHNDDDDDGGDTYIYIYIYIYIYMYIYIYIYPHIYPHVIISILCYVIIVLLMQHYGHK